MATLVYIVDDSDDYRYLLQRILTIKASGRTVQLFRSGEALYECAKTNTEQPDLILMDLNMPPGWSGFDTLRVLKQETNWHHVPVLIMSHEVSEGQKKQGIEAGAYSVLTKPTSSSEWSQFVKLVSSWGENGHPFAR